MPSSSDNRLSILRHRNFTLYLFAKILGTIAVQMQNVAIGWQVYAHSGKVFDLGMIGLAQFAPFVVLVLIAGQVADRWNRRLIIMLCFVAQAICGLLLLLLTITGMQAIWPVFVILVLFGSARAFIMPASQAILINLVPSANFSSAVALGSSSFHIAVITGPVLGGLFYLAGATTVYAVVTLLLGISAVLMLLVRTAPHVVRREPAKADIPAPGGDERILVVEDDADVLSLTLDMLKGLGYEVSTATNAKAAMQQIRSRKRIDLLFTDVVMPGGVSGVQLARMASEVRPELGILLTSGYVGEKSAIGENEFPLIDKPYDRTTLAIKLRQVLATAPAGMSEAARQPVVAAAQSA